MKVNLLTDPNPHVSVSDLTDVIRKSLTQISIHSLAITTKMAKSTFIYSFSVVGEAIPDLEIQASVISISKKHFFTFLPPHVTPLKTM